MSVYGCVVFGPLLTVLANMEKRAMIFEPMVRIYPEMEMWSAARGGFTFIISKDGDDPFMVSAKRAPSKPFQGERWDLGAFDTFIQAALACELWSKARLA